MAPYYSHTMTGAVIRGVESVAVFGATVSVKHFSQRRNVYAQGAMLVGYYNPDPFSVPGFFILG
jgi:hypothetical protein